MNERRESIELPLERHLTPEEYANLTWIASHVKQLLEKRYPFTSFLEMAGVKIVPDDLFQEFTENHERELLHPFYVQLLEQKSQAQEALMRFMPDIQDGWIDQPTNTLVIAGNMIDAINQDKVSGYSRFGLFLINQSFAYAAKRLILSGEDAQRYAQRAVSSAYRQIEEAGITSAEDSEKALAFLQNHNHTVFLRGLLRTVLVEDKKFTSMLGLPQDGAVINFLSKPVRIDFGHLIVNEFPMPLWKQNNTLALTEIVGIDTNLSQVLSNPSLVHESDERQKLVISGLDKMGIKGRINIFNSYVSGEMGRKIIEV